VALAHGDRPSLEREVGGYLVDIGYDAMGLRPMEEVHFDADLYTGTGDSIAYAPFQAIKVTVTDVKGGTVSDQRIENKQPNVPTFAVTFPAAGTYAFAVSYELGNKKTVATTFSLDVEAQNGSSERFDNMMHYVFAGFLVLVGIFAAVGIIRQRMKG
jgi:hypothetical protein